MGLQFPLEHCLTRGRQKIQQPPFMLVTRCYHRQDRLGKPTACEHLIAAPVRSVRLDGRLIPRADVNGEYYAFSVDRPHQGGPLYEGTLYDDDYFQAIRRCSRRSRTAKSSAMMIMMTTTVAIISAAFCEPWA